MFQQPFWVCCWWLPHSVPTVISRSSLKPPQVQYLTTHLQSFPVSLPTPKFHLFLLYFLNLHFSSFSSSVKSSISELLYRSDRQVSPGFTLLPPLGPFLGLLRWHPLLFPTLIFCALSLLFFLHMFPRGNPIYFMSWKTASVLYAEDFQINYL